MIGITWIAGWPGSIDSREGCGVWHLQLAGPLALYLPQDAFHHPAIDIGAYLNDEVIIALCSLSQQLAIT